MYRSNQFAAPALLATLIFLHTTEAHPRSAPPQSTPPAKSKRLPRPQPLGQNILLERDPASGDLHASAKDSPPAPGGGAIRSRVTLVQVACTVSALDGTLVRGLTQSDFHLFEDGVAQEIDSFDASATPASIVLVIDASPSIYRELAEMRGAARALAETLSPADEIAVVSFSSQAHLLLPFSKDRALLDRAIDSKYLVGVENSSESRIYESVFLAARELFLGRDGRKAIVLLTDGQDSGLGLTWDPASAHPSTGAAGSRLAFDDVAREFGSDGIALFIVSTENRPHEMTPEWLEAHREEMLVTAEARKQGMPNYTLYLAELARRAGGQLYFLRETGNLTEIYRRIAQAISAEYTLGYYPSAGTAKPGWRALRVELAAGANVPPGAKLTFRGSYYVSAFQ
ncbi:MAG TPA: VWA domain-containing protein [Candidatus Acidoferrales bacterium]|nr:VWA domain-containing protein [Candidatus Acidoferrales bacterium]